MFPLKSEPLTVLGRHWDFSMLQCWHLSHIILSVRRLGERKVSYQLFSWEMVVGMQTQHPIRLNMSSQMSLPATCQSIKSYFHFSLKTFSILFLFIGNKLEDTIEIFHLSSEKESHPFTSENHVDIKYYFNHLLLLFFQIQQKSVLLLLETITLLMRSLEEVM